MDIQLLLLILLPVLEVTQAPSSALHLNLARGLVSGQSRSLPRHRGQGVAGWAG